MSVPEIGQDSKRLSAWERRKLYSKQMYGQKSSKAKNTKEVQNSKEDRCKPLKETQHDKIKITEKGKAQKRKLSPILNTNIGNTDKENVESSQNDITDSPVPSKLRRSASYTILTDSVLPNSTKDIQIQKSDTSDKNYESKPAKCNGTPTENKRKRSYTITPGADEAPNKKQKSNKNYEDVKSNAVLPKSLPIKSEKQSVKLDSKKDVLSKKNIIQSKADSKKIEKSARCNPELKLQKEHGPPKPGTGAIVSTAKSMNTKNVKERRASFISIKKPGRREQLKEWKEQKEADMKKRRMTIGSTVPCSTRPSLPNINQNEKRLTVANINKFTVKVENGIKPVDTKTTQLRKNKFAKQNIQEKVNNIHSQKGISSLLLEKTQPQFKATTKTATVFQSKAQNCVKVESKLNIMRKSIIAKPVISKQVQKQNVKSTTGENAAPKIKKPARRSISSLYHAGQLEKAKNKRVAITCSQNSVIEKVIPESANKMKSSTQKKSVAFDIPIAAETSGKRLPKTPKRQQSLKERLESWLDQKGHSSSLIRHTRCFGYQLSDLKRSALHREQENVDAPSIDDSPNSLGESPTLRKRNSLQSENDNVDVKKILMELRNLMNNGFPTRNVTEWLNELQKHFPMVEKEFFYWICRSTIAEKEDNMELAVDVYQMALDKGVESSEIQREYNGLLHRYAVQNENKLMLHQEKVKRAHTPRKPLVDSKNIFDSTVIKYDLSCTVLGDYSSAPKVVVTPVRRSARLNRTPSAKTPKKDESVINVLPHSLQWSKNT